jgi:hypothetical protein
MSRGHIYFESPSGHAVTATLKVKRAPTPAHSMFRLELDARSVVNAGAAADLLACWLEVVAPRSEIFLSINAAPKVELGDAYQVVGNDKTSAVYSTSAPVTPKVLETLTTLPFGEVAFFSVSGGIREVRAHLPEISDWEGILGALGEAVHWVVAFDNDSGVLALLWKDEAKIKQQAAVIFQKSMG